MLDDVRIDYRLSNLLKRKRITPYRLAKESGISMQSLYPLVRGEATQVRFDSLLRIITALKSLTGEAYSVADLVEVVETTADALPSPDANLPPPAPSTGITTARGTLKSKSRLTRPVPKPKAS